MVCSLISIDGLQDFTRSSSCFGRYTIIKSKWFKIATRYFSCKYLRANPILSRTMIMPPSLFFGRNTIFKSKRVPYDDDVLTVLILIAYFPEI